MGDGKFHKVEFWQGGVVQLARWVGRMERHQYPPTTEDR